MATPLSASPAMAEGDPLSLSTSTTSHGASTPESDSHVQQPSSPGLSGKFRMRAGSLSRTLLGRHSSSRSSLPEHQQQNGNEGGSSSSSTHLALPERMRRMSNTSSTSSHHQSSSDGRQHLAASSSSTTSLSLPNNGAHARRDSSCSENRPTRPSPGSRLAPAAPSASFRSQPSSASWNRVPASQDEHVQQRLRALPRLSSYSKATGTSSNSAASTSAATSPRPGDIPPQPARKQSSMSSTDTTTPNSGTALESPASDDHETEEEDSGAEQTPDDHDDDDDEEDEEEGDMTDDHHSSPEADNNSPFFQDVSHSSTPVTSPDSSSPAAGQSGPASASAQQIQNQQQQQEQSHVAVGSTSWTAFAPQATPTTARPVAAESSTSYFDSRPTDAPPKDASRTPTASRPSSSSQQPRKAGAHSNSGSASARGSVDYTFGLSSPRVEAGEMLEREAKEVRDKLKTAQHFQLRAPPPAIAPVSEDVAATEASSDFPTDGDHSSSRRPSESSSVSADSLSEVSTSTTGAVSSAEGKRHRQQASVVSAPPGYDPGPPGARTPYAAVCPREDEGVEALPDYSCAVHIEGWMPRKPEFTAPGVQANHRNWRRQYVILHGTSLRVLSGDPNEREGRRMPIAPTAIRGAEPEQPAQMRAPTSTEVTSRRRRPSQQQPQPPESPFDENPATSPAPKAADEGEVDMSSGTAVIVRTNKTSKYSGTRNIYVHEGHYDGAKASLSTTLATKVLQKDRPETLRHYSLQGAESGLAADYTKRAFCIRIRAEGEQFLLQAADDRGVIDWIEALQAATNVALDLDSRPLPKFITLPRRRRRRRPQADGQQPANGTSANGQPRRPRPQQQMSENAAAAASGGATGAMGREVEEDQAREVSAF